MVDKEEIKIKYDDNFKKTFKKIDNSFKIKVKKQIVKITKNLEIGKPMKSNRKWAREVYSWYFWTCIIKIINNIAHD